MVYDSSGYFGSHLSNCPPNDAQPALGIIYRLVFNNPPNSSDFVPNVIEEPQRFNLQSNMTEEKLCIGHGISVCKDLEDIRKKKKRFKRKFRNSKIAETTLTSECGLIKQTGSDKSHYTWWLPPNVEVWHFFAVIEQQ